MEQTDVGGRDCDQCEAEAEDQQTVSGGRLQRHVAVVVHAVCGRVSAVCTVQSVLRGSVGACGGVAVYQSGKRATPQLGKERES